VLEALAVYEERIAELALSASATGQTVVKISTVSVTTISLVDSDARAGQSVIDAAQLVMVWTEVA
jgi:hypothetical protein